MSGRGRVRCVSSRCWWYDQGEAHIATEVSYACLAASLRDGLLRVWRPDGQMIVILEGCGEALVLAWSPDGNTLAAGSRNHTICLWH